MRRQHDVTSKVPQKSSNFPQIHPRAPTTNPRSLPNFRGYSDYALEVYAWFALNRHRLSLKFYLNRSCYSCRAQSARLQVRAEITRNHFTGPTDHLFYT
jgi:hypothetical protein